MKVRGLLCALATLPLGKQFLVSTEEQACKWFSIGPKMIPGVIVHYPE